MAVVVVLVAGGKHACGLASLLAFCGLLRSNEALQLLRRDLIAGDDSIVLLWPKAKTGSHQRVALRNLQTATFIRRWLAKFPGDSHTRVRAWRGAFRPRGLVARDFVADRLVKLLDDQQPDGQLSFLDWAGVEIPW